MCSCSDPTGSERWEAGEMEEVFQEEEKEQNSPPPDGRECAICWDTIGGDPATLPCCGPPPAESSTVYCLRCLEIICEHAPGGVGRCPTCRGFIKKVEGGGLAVADGLAQCACCNQVRPVVVNVQGRSICGAGSVGLRAPLRYECERCGRTQRIPHPMYRYQIEGPGIHGNNTWACHSGYCGDVGFTRWRIHPDDIARVPPDDCPDSWGRREEWLATVRRQRRMETATGQRRGTQNGRRGVERADNRLFANGTAMRELAILLAIGGLLGASFFGYI